MGRNMCQYFFLSNYKKDLLCQVAKNLRTHSFDTKATCHDTLLLAFPLSENVYYLSQYTRHDSKPILVKDHQYILVFTAIKR